MARACVRSFIGPIALTSIVFAAPPLSAQDDVEKRRLHQQCAQGAAEACGRLCDQDDAVGCSRLGLALLHGAGVERDETGAIETLDRVVAIRTRSCAAGDAADCARLGSLHRDGGLLAPVDYALALQFDQRACSLGDAYGCRAAAAMLGSNAPLGVVPDPGTAADLYRRAREIDERACQPSATRSCGLGEQAPPAPPPDAKACEAGDGKRCLEAARIYAEGLGVKRNLSRATALQERACDTGAPEGCLKAAKTHGGGKGDKARVVALYGKGCDGRVAEACNAAGHAWAQGRGVDRDPGRAASFFQKGCALRSAEACRALGLMYRDGAGVAQNRTVAQQILLEACSLSRSYSYKQPPPPVCTEACLAGNARVCEWVGRPDDAVRILGLGCDAGEAESCHALAQLRAKGERSHSAASNLRSLEQRACHLGSAEGCLHSGRAAFHAAELPAAALAYERACDLGSVEACGSAAGLFERGNARGSPKDQERARELRERAKELNRVTQSTGLYGLPRKNSGESCSSSTVLPFAFFSKRAAAAADRCARGSDGEGCALLAGLLLAGEDLPRDEARAALVGNCACKKGSSEGCLRACIAGDQESCERLDHGDELNRRLRELAHGRDVHSRAEAIGRIDDPALLRAIAAAEEGGPVRRAAVARLVAILVEGEPTESRAEVVRALTAVDVRERRAGLTLTRSSELVAAFALWDESPLVRRAATLRLDDQRLLRSIARRDTDPQVVRAAIGRIGDARARLALASEPEVHPLSRFGAGVAVETLDDADRYTVARTETTFLETRTAAAQAIADHSLLGELAWTAGASVVSVAAAGRITDTATLERLARAHDDEAVRRVAVDRIADPQILVELARSARSAEVRDRAVGRLGPDPVLLDFAWRGAHADVRVAAARAVRSLAELSPLVRDHPDAAVRAAAVARLEHVPEIVQAARADAEPAVRRAAVERLLSLDSGSEKALAHDALVELARTSVHAEVRELVVRKIADADLRKQLAASAPDAGTRALAARVLEEQRPARDPIDAVFVVGAQVGSQGPTLSGGLIIGRVSHPSSHTIIVPDTSVAGLLVQGELGPHSGKVSLGVATAAGFGPVKFGYSAKMSALQSRDTDAAIGVELQAAFLLKLTIGVFRGVGTDRRTTVSWGVGLGF